MDISLTITDVSILLAIWVAIYGIDSWRREYVGKRKIELAEDTLALFYEAADAMHHIRSPMGYSTETDAIEQQERESDEEYKARKTASVVFYRYNQHEKTFNKLHAMRYRFMAQIGKEQAKPFDDLDSIVKKIIISARMLSRLWARSHYRDNNDIEKHHAKIQEQEAVFWEGLEEDDPINPLLNQVIVDIEKICYEVINAKGTLFGFINLPLGKRANK